MSKDDQLQTLEKKVEQLAHQVGILEDEQAVRKLQHSYGYYLDKCLYNEVVALYAEDCEVQFMRGIFKGKAGVKRLYLERFGENFTGGRNGPVFGFLLDHPQYQDIVDIAPDRKTAKARYRCCMQAGLHESAEGETRQWWEGGLYENSYIKEDGAWKIKILNYRPVFHATFKDGWAYTKPNFVPFYTEADKFPGNPLGPDEINPEPVLWPDTDVLPFHYNHPVTGEEWTKGTLVQKK